MDMFPATLKLPMENPKQPFIPPADYDYIKPFLRILGYQGSLDKDFLHYVQQKKNVIQYPRFTKLIIADIMEKYESVPKRLEEDYHTIKDDTPLVSVYSIGEVTVRGMLIQNDLLTNAIKDTQAYKDYEAKYEGVEVPMIQPEPVESTQGTHRKPRATRTPNPEEEEEKRKTSYSSDRLEPESHKENLKMNDDDETKDDKKDDDDNDYADHDDHTLIKTQVSGSLEIRKEKIQTPIPSPPRSLGNYLSLDKAITQELMVFVSPTPATSSQDRSKPISRRYTHIQGAIKRMCMRQGFMMQKRRTRYVNNHHFHGIKEQVDKALKDIVPKLTTKVTNDLIIDNIPRIVTNAIKKEREYSQAVLWDVLKAKFEKPSASSGFCRYDAFHKHDHDEHQGDDAPPKGEKSAKRQKTSKSLKSARDEVIPKDETPELIEEFQNVDKRNGNTEEKRYTLSLHKIHAILFPEEDLEEKMNRWINHRKVRDDPEELFSDHRIVKVVSVTNKQQYRLDFMQRIIVIRGNDKPDSFSKADFKYLNKNDIEIFQEFQLGIESYHIKINLTAPTLTFPNNKACDPFSIVDKPTTGLIYLNIKNGKRFMDLEELSKFCDVTLEKDTKSMVEGSEVPIIKENPLVYETPKKKKKSQSVDKGKDKDFFRKGGLFKVLRDVGDGSVVCSWQIFARVGILCRHIFFVFKNANVEMISQQHILRRWTKNLIPATLRNKRNKYGEKNVIVENFANEETSIVDHCVHLLSKDEPRLDAFVKKLKLLKKDVEADNLEQLVGVPKPLVVDVNNPSVGTNKGRRNLRIKRGKEKAIKKSLKNRNSCLLCGGTDHNKRMCPGRFRVKGEEVVAQEEVVVQDEVSVQEK
ncbi:hypothetical protein Tco_1132112 [Tanacetum coccineum]|uniref:Protein FAR1-RELATED SEQUENCE n=1 Tax=Tanacetum coccineum TaxID=301880 RepID=A0ABQ5JAZ5_9ASTR